MSKAPRGFVPYCEVYHCAGDCGLPHNQEERIQHYEQAARAEAEFAEIDEDNRRFPLELTATSTEEAMSNDERAAFEAWMTEDTTIPVEVGDDGMYADTMAECMWHAWQARAAIAQPAEPATVKDSLTLALAVLRENNQWHIDYDEHDGYDDSTLQSRNLAAIHALEQAQAPQADAQPVAPLFDCDIKARPLAYPLADYHRAGIDGPLAFTWKDKPHRLLYDLIAAVKYYAAAPPARQPQWMPIETAPKDATAVLVMRDIWPGTKSGRAEECNSHNTYVAQWWAGERGGAGAWICYMDAIQDPECPIEPTHWMPLPTPPGGIGGGGVMRDDQVDGYGNPLSGDRIINCCFPDCGCDGARLCQAENGPSFCAQAVNLERGSVARVGEGEKP